MHRLESSSGKIYCIPRNAAQVLIIDPSTDTVDTSTISVSVSRSTYKWMGGALAGNGKIYCFPDGATQVLIIDPSTEGVDTTTIAGFPNGQWLWWDGWRWRGGHPSR